MEELIIKVNGKEYKVAIEETEEGKIKVYCGNDVYEIETKSESEIKSIEQKESEGELAIAVPLPGLIIDINVKKGENVKKGQVLAKLIAMKMENEIIAPRDGIIKEIRAKRNSNVNRGDIIIIML